MAKGLNEGDAIEGIYAIAGALKFTYGEINKTKLNKIRTTIEPAMFSKGRFTETITEYGVGPDGDSFTTTLVVRLKPKSVEGAYGRQYNVLFKQGKDIGNLDAKINTLIKEADIAFSPLITVRNRLLSNNKTDMVDFEIIADGVEGEQSGGAVKGDIMVNIKANGRPIKKEGFSFSLKSGSKTLSNLSPYVGLMRMMDKFGLEYVYEDEFAGALGPGGPLERATTPQAKKSKVNMLSEMYNGFIEGLEGEGGSKVFTKTAFDVLFEAAFGDDFASVIDVDKSKVKLMDPDLIMAMKGNALKNNTYLYGTIVGSGDKRVLQIHFDRSWDSKNTLLSFRKKFRVSSGGSMELKLYVEAGKKAYV